MFHRGGQYASSRGIDDDEWVLEGFSGFGEFSECFGGVGADESCGGDSVVGGVLYGVLYGVFFDVDSEGGEAVDCACE